MADVALRVLLIEDNADHSTLIESHLKHVSDVRLERVNSLESGLALLTKGRTDALLLDLGLPDSEGLETLAKTVKSFPELPIIVLTTLDDERLAIEAVKEGAQDYLTKDNVTGEVLLRAIRYAIERKAQQPKAKEELHQRTLYFSDGEWEAVRRKAFDEDRKYTDVIREIVREYFDVSLVE